MSTVAGGLIRHRRLPSEPPSTLLRAAATGDAQAVRALLGAAADKETASRDGCTPLMVASAAGHVEAVKALLEAGASLEARNAAGKSALWLAAEGGHIDVLRPLIWASPRQEHIREVADALMRGASTSPHATNCQAVLRAALQKSLMAPAASDEGGARQQETPPPPAAAIRQPQPQQQQHPPAAAGATPLSAPSGGWWAFSVAALLLSIFLIHVYVEPRMLPRANAVAARELQQHARGAGRNAGGAAVALMSFAARKGSEAMVAAWNATGLDEEKLAAYGLKWAALIGRELQDRRGRTALLAAAAAGDAGKVRALLEAGADKDRRDKAGYTPLLAAAANGHAAVLQMLLKAGADKMAQTEDGHTALFLAAGNGHIDVVNVLLIQAKVQKDPVDKVDRTPLWIAAANGHTDVMYPLVTRGADVEARDVDGRTPLLAAARNGQVDAVEVLLNANAKLAVADEAANRLGEVGERGEAVEQSSSLAF
ncbi:hypothetical protein GPECTOR_20g573 [Gonium pectorale]|uniref:Uncharacterized protein n=1 Tax=Gonium pectorale TaxID=33097 RepID=A0A150GIU6_GONPE|nr:hypothetical protein GPECTOR_20g573 [Gonium pectorale]|eukprot:KXZ49716.1 hypothetical protein GPECTOR_20g573 [Gonium pectorale]